MTPTCDLCSRPLSDTAYVCSHCANLTAKDLLRIAELASEVEAAIAKLTRYGTSGKASGERPLPFDEKAAERASAVGNTVATWARHVAESRGLELPHDLATPVSSVAAEWLAEQLEWLRHQPEAAEAMRDLQDAAREIQRVVDRPVDRWYAGACWADLGELDEAGEPLRCQEDLYALPRAKTVRCRECGAEYDAEKRREWLLDEARDQLLHAEWIARALSGMGIEVTGSRIRNLAARGRLMEKGHDEAGRPIYRVGDVRDLIDEQARVEADRQAKREEKARRKAERERSTA